jgi:hypothetical protein
MRHWPAADARGILLGRQRSAAGGTAAALVNLVKLNRAAVRVTQEKLLRLRAVDAHRYSVVGTQSVEFGASLHHILDSQSHVRPRRILARTVLGQWCLLS